jgi:phosphoglycolate phosphatase
MDRHVLIFDYDGTIHETLRIYEPAMRDSFCWLFQQYGIKVPEISDRQIASWLGVNSIDTWQLILPDCPENIREEASDHVAAHMAKLVEQGYGKWYDGMREQLVYLKSQGYTMIVLSNCRISYKNAHWNAFAMHELFDKFYDCESFGYLPKEDIFQYIKEEFPGSYIVIGDRFSDIKCAVKNSLKSAGCLYGYGSPDELSDADILISSPKELSEAIKELTIPT